eukprot:CAMPEP_0174900728 /NCGR_PEP_ID=MMETSP0167-20121228/32398_1 /TAXON_ID=38298 /ORGANISM="Rhodella maculata, Strain CCMP736" /LENGTH=58 /DNA_ID=CAMNT_0016142211 /DNA_START=27 /DNA_END=199 /DNA_ORIENTATION=-
MISIGLLEKIDKGVKWREPPPAHEFPARLSHPEAHSRAVFAASSAAASTHASSSTVGR